MKRAGFTLIKGAILLSSFMLFTVAFCPNGFPAKITGQASLNTYLEAEELMELIYETKKAYEEVLADEELRRLFAFIVEGGTYDEWQGLSEERRRNYPPAYWAEDGLHGLDIFSLLMKGNFKVSEKYRGKTFELEGFSLGTSNLDGSYVIDLKGGFLFLWYPVWHDEKPRIGKPKPKIGIQKKGEAFQYTLIEEKPTIKEIMAEEDSWYTFGTGIGENVRAEVTKIAFEENGEIFLFIKFENQEEESVYLFGDDRVTFHRNFEDEDIRISVTHPVPVAPEEVPKSLLTSIFRPSETESSPSLKALSWLLSRPRDFNFSEAERTGQLSSLVLNNFTETTNGDGVIPIPIESGRTYSFQAISADQAGELGLRGWQPTIISKSVLPGEGREFKVKFWKPEHDYLPDAGGTEVFYEIFQGYPYEWRQRGGFGHPGFERKVVGNWAAPGFLEVIIRFDKGERFITKRFRLSNKVPMTGNMRFFSFTLEDFGIVESGVSPESASVDFHLRSA